MISDIVIENATSKNRAFFKIKFRESSPVKKSKRNDSI